jgi:hypothetical protein
MIKRKAFCEFGAYAVNVLDPSKIVIMPLRTAGDLGLPIGQTVTLDFTKILDPQSKLEAVFDAATVDALGVEVDGSDKLPAPAYPHNDGLNVLTIGPTFPAGPHVGGVSCERTKFYAEIRPVLDPGHDQWPAFKLRTYQIMTTATFDTATQKLARYHGFHAKVIADNGSVKELEIETRRVTVDLTDRALCDDPAAVRNEIQDPHRPNVVGSVLTAASRVGDEGAVFLALAFCAKRELRQGKQPPGGGYSIATTRTDAFAESVFSLSLSRSRRIDIASTDVAGIRDELIAQITRVGDVVPNLDLVADAPGGLQTFGTQGLIEIFEGDRRLARLVRTRFTRVRLLGCYTALSAQARARMQRLATLVGLPVLGTTRAISWSDFDKYGFKDYQVINGMRTTILKSTEQMSTAGEFDDRTEQMLAAGLYQQSWLGEFPQVPLELADVRLEVANAPTVAVPPALFQAAAATTDQIAIAPEASVVLQAEAMRIPADVLASATLLRLRSRKHGALYLNLAPDSPLRVQLSHG